MNKYGSEFSSSESFSEDNKSPYPIIIYYLDNLLQNKIKKYFNITFSIAIMFSINLIIKTIEQFIKIKSSSFINDHLELMRMDPSRSFEAIWTCLHQNETRLNPLTTLLGSYYFHHLNYLNKQNQFKVL